MITLVPAVEHGVYSINTQQFMMRVFSKASSDQNLSREFMSLFLSLWKATVYFLALLFIKVVDIWLTMWSC